MKLIFERGEVGQNLSLMPECDVPEVSAPSAFARETKLNLPHVSENELSRHYTELAKCVHGVNDGFYPLGSCTMKYNPKVNEEMAALPGFTKVHPLQDESTVQGSLEVLYDIEKALAEISGMDAVTLQPAAGAHGEFTGLMLIKCYLEKTGQTERKNIIVPDSAHGTNPASAMMCGFNIVNIPSGADGCVDLEALKAAVGPDTAGLMLTNPNTVGVFDKNILAITEIVHNAGGLCYYDGANLNAVMGVVRPGDMGFDCIHFNLHKTFSTPHGGGGPGSGPVGCKTFLEKFLPGLRVNKDETGFHMGKAAESMGAVKAFWGNFTVVVKALAYIKTLGKEGIPEAAKNAVLNANYMQACLKEDFDLAYDVICMHEFVLTLEELHKETGVSALDLAKGLLDNGIHPPTMYFPLIVHEALMIEPTETEPKEMLDEAIAVFKSLKKVAYEDPQALHDAPLHTPVRRLDDVRAARIPVLKYSFES